MMVSAHIQEVPLSQVDLDKPLVAVPAVPAPALLMEALREVGMLCLPWLRRQRGGRLQVVVMIVNHPDAPETQPAMDALLRWIYEGAR